MLKAARLSKVCCGLLALTLVFPGFELGAAEAVQFKKNRASLSRDIFDQNFYYEGTNLLRLDRLYRKIFRKKKRAKNVNIFDEVPDSTFFINRHFKQPLTDEELALGYHETSGPDLSGDLVITRGKFEGNNPGFFIKDAKGNEYLLKFDASDNIELESAAEIIGSRFYHAFGYNVPQNTIIHFDPSKLVTGEGVKIVDTTGFSKELTPERLQEYLVFLPLDDQGRLRASASKFLHNTRGGFSMQGRRRNDPNDPFYHEDRREIRALRVFSSWLHNNDVRQHNTLDVEIQENGKSTLKHYIIDLNSSLGAAVHNVKPPHFTHEYLFDFGETTKAILGLGLWEKPWQKRWREAGEKIENPQIGYFDNNRLDPKKWKTQLPHYAFKDLTRADGFWASKILMSFKDSDIAAIAKSGQYTDPANAEAVASILSERRDIIARYWFSQSNPLDSFDVKNGKLVFEDLAVKYSFEKPETTVYRVQVIKKNGNKGKKAAEFDAKEPSFAVDPQWFEGAEKVDVLIRTSRAEAASLSPYVLVELTDNAVTGIFHED